MTATTTTHVPGDSGTPPGPVVVASGDRAMSLGVTIAMAADFVVLGAVVAAFLAIKGDSPEWPPKGVALGTYIPTVVGVTALLSAFSAQWAVFAARRNDQRNVAIGLALTAFFALAIANAQWLALTQPKFGVPSHAYGTFYYLLVGYHLFHVIAAIPMLGLVAGRALAGHFPPGRTDAVRATAIFWQATSGLFFVIVTVLFLFSPHA